jgi:hypothetical protein
MGFFTKKPTVHPDFPELPLGLRLGSVIKFQPSTQTYFLLNESKLAVSLPDDDCIVNSISHFKLLGLDIYRAYLNSPDPKTILQIHVRDRAVLDVILFNATHDINVDGDRVARREWENMIGFKDISTPAGFTYFREWSGNIQEYGEFIDPLEYYESYFNVNNPLDKISIQNRAMLYSRILDGGTDEDIEFLLLSFMKGLRNERVEIWAGVVIGAEGIQIY